MKTKATAELVLSPIGADTRANAGAHGAFVRGHCKYLIALFCLVHVTLRLGAAVLPGSIDSEFQPDVDAEPYVGVTAIARDNSGRLIVAANRKLQRLLPEGSRDLTFPVIETDGNIRVITQLSDGRAFVGGDFSTIAGVQRDGIARLQPDGTIDTTFAVAPAAGRRDVLTIAVQASGYVLVGGNFNAWDGTQVPNITRLKADGEHEPQFATNITPAFSMIVSNTVTTGSATNDGDWIFTGSGTTVSGQTVSGTMSRIDVLPDGNLLIVGVIAGEFSSDGALIRRLPLRPNWAHLSDGTFLVANSEWIAGQLAYVHLRKVRADGSLDPDWRLRHACDGDVHVIAIEPDGKIILGGSFSVLGGQRHQNLARLNPDGSIDSEFVSEIRTSESGWADPVGLPGLSRPFTAVHDLIVLPGNRLLVSGFFSNSVSGQLPGLARVIVGDMPDSGPVIVESIDPAQTVEGSNLLLGFTLRGTPPLKVTWTRDELPVEGATDPVLHFSPALISDSGVYRLHVSNALGQVTSPPLGLVVDIGPTHPGSVDYGFRAPALMPRDEESFTWTSRATAVGGATLAGEKVYIYADSRRFGGVDGHRTINAARLNRDGSVDREFVMLRNSDLAARLRMVRELIPLRDGRVLASLDLSYIPNTPDGDPHQLIALLPDGSVDPGFRLGLRLHSRVLSRIGPVAEVAGGKILVAGEFAVEGRVTPARMGRVEADGRPDESYVPPDPALIPRFILPAPDGHFTVVFEDGAVGNEGLHVLGHLGPDGTMETLVPVALPFRASLRRAAMNGQGGILLAPARQLAPEAGAPLIVRILPDGMVDPDFNVRLDPDVPASAEVLAIAIQSNGSILLSVPNAGFIPDIEAAPRTLLRLWPDGVQDPEFRIVPLRGAITSILITPAQQITIAGFFTEFTGPLLRGLARLHAFDERRLYNARIEGGSFEATLHTRPARRYVIESSPQAAGGPWDVIGTVIGDGSETEIRDGYHDQCFYRARIDK